MNRSGSIPKLTRRGPLLGLVVLAFILGCVLDIRLDDESGEDNAGSICGSDELLALAFTVDVETNWHPATWPVADWWFVYPGDGPSYAISRCADEVITLPDYVLLTPIPDQPSALYFADDLETGGLMRIDLAEAGRTTRLHTMPGNGDVGPFDGAGGVFFDKTIPNAYGDPFVKGDVAGYWNEVWRAPDLITPNSSVKLHPAARGPFEMADGWYLCTSESSWSRVDLSTNTLAPIHAATWFVVPNGNGDAWVWADATDGQVKLEGVESFVHHLDSGSDVPIGPVRQSNTSYPVGLRWNAAGTHVLMRERVASEAFLYDVYDFVGIDANTGLRSMPLPAEDGWMECQCILCRETLDQDFVVCRTEKGSREFDYYRFDPATGSTALLQGKDVAEPRLPGWKEGDKGYYPLTDGRYITGQSLPGFPMDDDYPPIDRLQMFLVDHEHEVRLPLVAKYPNDTMAVSTDSRLVAYTDSDRDGFYIRPLPATPPD
jgi:hypothetical protein